MKGRKGVASNLRRKSHPSKFYSAKRMRAQPTHCEHLLWLQLKGKQFHGLKFRRQSVIRGYIADFYCPAKSLVIEVDGPTHNPSYDRVRDQRIKDLGLSTIRFTNAQVLHNITWVLAEIGKACGFKNMAAVQTMQNANFSTIPPRQQQQDKIKLNDHCCDDECGGKVEKPLTYQEIEDLALAKLCARNVKTVDFGVREVLGCRRQSFASYTVAENTARTLEKLGIKATPERCAYCRMVHLKESRK